MKLYLICFIFSIILFSNCAKSSFLIKRKYTKGFYLVRSNKLNAENIAFCANTQNKEITIEQITVTEQKCDLPLDYLSNKPSVLNKTDPFKAFNAAFQRCNNSNTSPKNTSKQLTKIVYKSNDTKNHIISCVTLILVLAILVVLTKAFGLIFIAATCFIIAFTAIAAFFLLRTHLN